MAKRTKKAQKVTLSAWLQKKNVQLLLVIAALVLGLFVKPLISLVSAKTKVDICHADSAGKKPYVSESPNANGDVSGHADHTGGVYPAANWGDIIPPFDYEGGHFPGLNWTAEGQAIFNNDCNLPSPTPTPTKVPTLTPSPTLTLTPSPTTAPTLTPSPTDVPTPTLTPSPTVMPTVTPTPSEEPTPTPKKIDICHADSAGNKPYVQNSPNANGDVSGHDDHDGGVFPADPWGDIIPPFDYEGGHYDGKNWTAEGQAIYNNGCNVPEVTPTVTPTATPTPEVTPTVTPEVTPTVTPEVTPTSGPTPTEGPHQPGKESSLANDSMCVNGDFEAVFDVKENGNAVKDVLVKFEFNGSTKEAKTNEQGRAKVSFRAGAGTVKAWADGFPSQQQTLEDPHCPVVHMDPGGRGGQVLGVSTLAATGSSLFTMIGLSSVAMGLFWLKRELRA